MMSSNQLYKIKDLFVRENTYITIAFKIDDIKFSITFYGYIKSINYIIRKQLGTTVLKNLVKNSTYISIKDHLSSYVFEQISKQQPIDMSQNQILLNIITRMRRILNNFKYDTSKKLKDQTEIIYNKVWKNEISSFL